MINRLIQRILIAAIIWIVAFGNILVAGYDPSFMLGRLFLASYVLLWLVLGTAIPSAIAIGMGIPSDNELSAIRDGSRKYDELRLPGAMPYPEPPKEKASGQGK